MAGLAFVFQKLFLKIRSQLYSAKTFWLLIFPVTQFFAIYTLIAILQQFGHDQHLPEDSGCADRYDSAECCFQHHAAASDEKNAHQRTGKAESSFL